MWVNDCRRPAQLEASLCRSRGESLGVGGRIREARTRTENGADMVSSSPPRRRILGEDNVVVEVRDSWAQTSPQQSSQIEVICPAELLLMCGEWPCWGL